MKYFIGYTVAETLCAITPSQAKRLTHLNIAFGVVENNLISIEAIRKFFRFIPKLREYNPKLNILLSTGGGNAFGHGTATDSHHLDAFVNSTMDIIEEFDFDGIDCDWEFPGNTGNPDEKYQHTALLKAYREKLDNYSKKRSKKSWLTIAAAAGQWFLDTTEMEKIHPYLDFINLMTYDLRGWAQPTGHHTNLFEPIGAPIQFSTHKGVELLRGIGIPTEKIIIGVAFYARQWDGVKSCEKGGLHQESETIGDYGPDYTTIYHIFEKSERFVKHWDDTAKAPWLFDGYTFISYDDPMSIQHKCNYVKQQNLGGIMYWQHGCDRTGILFDAIYNGLYL